MSFPRRLDPSYLEGKPHDVHDEVAQVRFLLKLGGPPGTKRYQDISDGHWSSTTRMGKSNKGDDFIRNKSWAQNPSLPQQLWFYNHHS